MKQAKCNVFNSGQLVEERNIGSLFIFNVSLVVSDHWSHSNLLYYVQLDIVHRSMKSIVSSP